MRRKLTQLLLLLAAVATLAAASSCRPNSSSPALQELAQLKTLKARAPGGTELKLFIAEEREDQAQGLSGLKEKDFPDNWGMLFVYAQVDWRQFWMPDTHFDLDIFFLDRQFVVIDAHRSLPAHPAQGDPQEIPRSKRVKSRHVLELKADSPAAKEMKIGQRLILLDAL